MTSLLKTPSLSINLDQAQTPLDSVKTGQSLDVPTGQAGVVISEPLISPSNSLSDIALQEVSAIVYHPMTVSNCTNVTQITLAASPLAALLLPPAVSKLAPVFGGFIVVIATAIAWEATKTTAAFMLLMTYEYVLMILWGSYKVGGVYFCACAPHYLLTCFFF